MMLFKVARCVGVWVGKTLTTFSEIMIGHCDTFNHIKNGVLCMIWAILINFTQVGQNIT